MGLDLQQFEHFSDVTGTQVETAPNGVTFKIDLMTPEKAFWFMRGKFTFEDHKAAAVELYSQIMSKGGWVYNAQPILVGEDGKILDGKKRLLACIQSGTSFPTLIASGIKHDVLHTVDQHRRRNYAGVLQARGIQNAASIIRIMNKVIRMERGLFGKPSNTISWGRFEQVLRLNDGFVEAAAISEEFYGSPIHSTARPVIAFLALKSGKETELMDLFNGLKDPSSLAGQHPAKKLFRQLEEDRKNKAKPDVDEMIVMGIQAINDLAQNVTRNKSYGWERDYGSCQLDANGHPISRQEVIDMAPGNLGMPQIEGYPGIKLGNSVDFSQSALVSTLVSGATVDASSTGLRYMEVTPELAAEWLQKFNLANRTGLQQQINAMARDILNGNWMFNAQPIAFHGDPMTGEALLVNGQHRLEACIKAGQPIDVLVATGLPKEAFATYDTHVRRGTRGVLSKGDERVVIAAAKLQWRVDNNMSPLDTSMPSSAEVYQTIEAHPSLIEAFPISRKKEMQEIASAGILTFFIAHIQYADAEMAARFLDQMLNEDQLDVSNPIYKTRKSLIERRGDLTRREVLAVLLNCWEDFLTFQAEKAEKDYDLY